MESLSETPWDITISGTGLAQSLLALSVYDLRLLFKLVSNLPHILSEPFHGQGKKSYMLTKIRSTEGLRQPLAFRRLKNG
jgi:Rab proteins geranylgeranyltransferase component A